MIERLLVFIDAAECNGKVYVSGGAIWYRGFPARMGKLQFPTFPGCSVDSNVTFTPGSLDFSINSQDLWENQRSLTSCGSWTLTSLTMQTVRSLFVRPAVPFAPAPALGLASAASISILTILFLKLKAGPNDCLREQVGLLWQPRCQRWTSTAVRAVANWNINANLF